MKAKLNGVTLAESDRTVVVEGNHYFPADSVNWEALSPSRTKSICPWKGVASYYNVEAAGTAGRSAAWTYRHPYPWIRKIRGRVAFWGPVTIEP